VKSVEYIDHGCTAVSTAASRMSLCQGACDHFEVSFASIGATLSPVLGPPRRIHQRRCGRRWTRHLHCRPSQVGGDVQGGSEHEASELRRPWVDAESLRSFDYSTQTELRGYIRL
jgi:hypothetical protein